MRKKIFIILSIVFCSFFLSGCILQKKSTEQPSPAINPIPTTVVPTKPIEESIKERPFVSLTPIKDGHWVSLKISQIRSEITGIEYDLVYLADMEGNRIERGVSTGGKPVELNGQKEFVKEILFGSASCTTGVCKYKYDENVNEGTLTLTLIGNGIKEKYESVYRIQKGKDGKEGLTTGDGIFKFSSDKLPASSLYLTISSIGIPSPLPEGLVAKSIPYGIFNAPNVKGEVYFKSSEKEAKIYFLNGSNWQELETTAGDGILSASAPKAGIFILVQKSFSGIE